MAEELARKELLLRELVVHIAGRTGMLLELVNYNVEGKPSACSATRRRSCEGLTLAPLLTPPLGRHGKSL